MTEDRARRRAELAKIHIGAGPCSATSSPARSPAGVPACSRAPVGRPPAPPAPASTASLLTSPSPSAIMVLPSLEQPHLTAHLSVHETVATSKTMSRYGLVELEQERRGPLVPRAADDTQVRG